MINAINKSVFYVSNLGSNKVSIIHGKNFDVIDEIKVGARPFEMAVDNKNNLFIAIDREEKVTIINDETKAIKKLDIPNNGHIKVDSISQRIYVSNTEEINIYSLKNYNLIHKINGFMVVDGIELSSDESKLFILDIFKNIIKVYDTTSFKLIKIYKDIGENLNYIYIGNNDRYLCIANKGINKFNTSGNITLIDFYTDEKTVITLSKETIITSIEIKDNLLYAVDSGINKIEIIDIFKKYIVGNIETSLSNPHRLKILKNFNLLVATSSDNEGRGALDLINIDNFKILNTFNFKEIDSKPYDIAVIQENFYKEEDNLKDKEINIINNEKKGEFILAKKIISTYKEQLLFNQEKIKINYEENLYIEKIVFENCRVIEESKNKEIIEDKEDYIALNFNFIIPYYIKCINSKKERLIINGNLRGREKSILYINNNEDNNLEFIIKSDTKSMYLPYIKEKNIIFDATITIFTYAVKEELIFIPSIE